MKEDVQIRLDNATESHYQRARNLPPQPLSERLAGRGVRLTQKRRMLLGILEQADRHLDATGLLEDARQHMKIDRATVYRTIDLLKKEGLIDELDLLHLRGEMHYYETRTEKEHFHFACFGCGRIEEVASPLFGELQRRIGEERGLQIATARLEIGGYCPECRARDKKEGGMTG